MSESKTEKVETTYIDHLTEDEPIINQRFVCLSFLSPEGIRNCSTRGIKVRGSFAEKEDAEAHIKKLQMSDPDHDIFIGEVGKWLPWDPDPNSVQDRKYQESELQKIEEGYKRNLERKKALEEKRKRDLTARAARMERQNTKKQTRIDRMRKKLEEKKQKQELPENSGFKELEDQLKMKEESLLEEKKMIDEVKTTIDSEKSEVDAIDEQLKAIKDMYKKMKNKS